MELPDNYSNLKYSNILCGAIRYMSQNNFELLNLSFSVFSHRGALEMVHLEVAAWFAQDNLKVIRLNCRMISVGNFILAYKS